MIKFTIMSFMLGFTGNKLFNKHNSDNIGSVEWGCLVGIVCILIHAILTLN